MYLHARPKLFRQEVFIVCDLEFDQLVPGARIDVINNLQLISGRIRMLLQANFGIEITAALKIVEQIPAPLIEQVLIDCVLLEDRYVLFEQPSSDLKPLCNDLNFRS